MTQPQAQEPGAGLQLDVRHLAEARRQRVLALTEENDMINALNAQCIEHIRALEEELERYKSKETDGAQPPQADSPKVEPETADGEQRRNGSVGGPSPADIARRARTRGGKGA